MSDVLILAIESSCDETSAAIVDSDKNILLVILHNKHLTFYTLACIKYLYLITFSCYNVYSKILYFYAKEFP